MAMENTPGFPHKETVDYAKNMAFCVGIAAFSLSTTLPYHDDAKHQWVWILFNGFMGLLTATLGMISTRAYMKAFPSSGATAKAVAEVLAGAIIIGSAAFISWKLHQQP